MANETRTDGQPKTTRVRKAVDGLLSKAQVADMSKVPGPKKVITMSAIKQFIEDLLAQYGGAEGIQRAISDLAAAQLERDQFKDKLAAAQEKLQAAAAAAETLRQQAEAANKALADAQKDFEKRLADAQKEAGKNASDAQKEADKRIAELEKRINELDKRAGKAEVERDKEVKEHYATEEKLTDAVSKNQDIQAKIAAIEERVEALANEKDELAAWARQLEEALAGIKDSAEKALVRPAETRKATRKTVRKNND